MNSVRVCMWIFLKNASRCNHVGVHTCSTIGSCSGGFRFSTPIVNQTWKAVSCSAKKGLCCGDKYAHIYMDAHAQPCIKSQSAVTKSSFYHNLDTSRGVTTHRRNGINPDLSWSPSPYLTRCCHGSMPDWLVAGGVLITQRFNAAAGIRTVKNCWWMWEGSIYASRQAGQIDLCIIKA